jgi:transcriptional regulator with XRE-family HTH domain
MIDQALKLARLYWGYSQEEMALRSGIAQSYISEIETGKKKPTLDMIEQYSAALNLRPWQLLLFSDQVGDEPPLKKGRLMVAGHALALLEKLKPSDQD